MNASEEKSKSLRQQLLELEVNEKGLMDQLASSERDLVDADRDSRELREAAKSIKKRLQDVERSAEIANANFTIISDAHRQSVAVLRSLKESTERLVTLESSVQERLRKYELKLSMLRTDVNASQKILNDTKETLAKQRSREYRLRQSAENVTATMLSSLERVAAVRSEERILGEQVERLRREVTDESTLLDSQVSQKESRIGLVAEAQQKLDNTRTELLSLRQTYKHYIEGTLQHQIEAVRELEKRGNGIIGNLNATRLREPPPREVVYDEENTQKIDEASPENLRNFVRESRVFLSKHGYKNPISLIEGIAADFDADFVSFREKSSELANIRELSDVDEALLEDYSRLTTSLQHLHELSGNLKGLRMRFTGELETLERNNASVTAIGHEISSRRDSLNMDQSLLKNETANDELLRAKVTYLENESHKIDALSLQNNKTMAEAFARLQSSLRDVAVQESALSELREAVGVTELATIKLKKDARDAEILVGEAYQAASSLQNETEVFGQDADQMQRLYMEKMADVSELTRRLNDLVRRIADAESSRERILRDIRSQKKQIQASLSHRESLTEALGVEVRVHNDFVDKKGDIQGSLDQRACTT